jgi:hypothetical protein
VLNVSLYDEVTPKKKTGQGPKFMVKCFKLPVIQVCIAFEGFFPGSLLGKNRVVSRGNISIFTIAKIVKSLGRITK